MTNKSNKYWLMNKSEEKHSKSWCFFIDFIALFVSLSGGPWPEANALGSMAWEHLGIPELHDKMKID